MLSFTKTSEKDVVLAHVYPDAEGQKPETPIFYVPKFSGASQLVRDDLHELLKFERLRILRQYGLTDEEYGQLVELVKNEQDIAPDTDRTLKRAHLEIKVLVEKKLKKEITFAESDKAYLRINYDTEKPKTNYIVGVFGSSGSGKSYSVAQLLLRDPALFEYNMVYLIGSVGADDPSYEPLKDAMFEKWRYINTSEMENKDFDIARYANCAIIFDDIDSESNPKLRKKIQRFRDRCLQTARHYSIRIINTAHLFNSYRETSKIRNSARWLFIFPRSIPHTLLQILTKSFNMKNAEAMHLTNICKRDGRLTVISKNAPTFLMTPKRLILL